MTDRPIIFSGLMVKELLAKGKTQTRRIINPAPPEQPAANCHPSHEPRHPAPYLDAYCGQPKTDVNPRGMSQHWCWWQVDDRQCLPTFKCPYGVPGDRLWVRENLKRAVGGWAYRADGAEIIMDRTDPRVPQMVAWAHHKENDFYSSRHMPRWASRMTLEVRDIRVQRLKDICEDDTLAEGIAEDQVIVSAHCAGGQHTEVHEHRYFHLGGPDEGFEGPIDAYLHLWASLHGQKSVDDNPWVWAVTFEQVAS